MDITRILVDTYDNKPIGVVVAKEIDESGDKRIRVTNQVF